MKKIDSLIFGFVILIILLLTSCGSVKRNKTTTITDSTIYREYNVPVKIKETRITQELQLDSLCSVYESLIVELKRRKEKETTIIYKDSHRGDLEAKIDSLGRFILLARTNALDTAIKGKETIRVKKEVKQKTVEKEGSKWWMWLLIGSALAILAPYIIKLAIKSIKPF